MRRRVLKLERDSWKFFSEFNSFAFDKTSFDTWWVTGGVMCVVNTEMFQLVYSEFLCQGQRLFGIVLLYKQLCQGM